MVDQFVAGFIQEIVGHAAAVLQDDKRSRTLWHSWSSQLDLLNAARADIEALGGFQNAFPELTATVIRINEEINSE